MPDEKDLEIARLKGQIEGMQAAGRRVKPKPDGDKPNRIGIAILVVVLVGVAAFIGIAWNSGKQQAAEDDAFTYACELATENADEATACVTSMKADYIGPLDDPERVANAVAAHVAKMRDGEN